MKRVLYITSSLSKGDSVSSHLAEKFILDLKQTYPGSVVNRVDLAQNPLPHLGHDEFSAWTVPTEERTLEQSHLARLSDGLIEQLLDHDILVLAVPMYNLGIPSTLKAWIDRIARAGKTFRYTSDGPKGLVGGVSAYVFFARGGVYRNTSMDTQTDYISGILGLMGIQDVQMVYAEGLNMGDLRESSLEQAHAQLKSLLDGNLEEVVRVCA